MTTVLIAADDSDDAVATARFAGELFGDDATYYVIHVGRFLVPGMAWGTPYPVVGGAMMFPSMWDATSGDGCSAEAAAEERAADVASQAEVPDASALGDAGDPATAILRAGRENGADVIVVGSHDRSWFSRLLEPSVSDQLVKESTIPVLVVK